MASGESKATTDHETIRQWTEDRGGWPACVRGTGDEDEMGPIRLDFPGYSGGHRLERMSWDDFFAAFDEKNLALVYQEATKYGEKSRFNKIVNRDSVKDDLE